MVEQGNIGPPDSGEAGDSEFSDSLQLDIGSFDPESEQLLIDQEFINAILEEEEAESSADIDEEAEEPEQASGTDALEISPEGPILPGEHVVAQGECLTSIAYRAGFFEKTLWKHAKNASLKKKRKDPNFLLPGDKVFIPEKELRMVSRPTDHLHRFVRKGVPANFRLQLLVVGQPRANVEYLLYVDGKLLTGRTDKEGWLEQSIPPDAQKGLLVISPGPNQEEEELVFGGVDPLDEISGIQGRLQNLGYGCWITGTLDEATKVALSEFQDSVGLKVTGEPDAETQQKLEEAHHS